MRACVLLDIEERMQFAGRQLSDCNLELSQEHRCEGTSSLHAAAYAAECKTIREELIEPELRDEMAADAHAAVLIMRDPQKEVFDAIERSVVDNLGHPFFIDALGGAGKTFTINALLRSLRSKGYIVLAAASSGIAAILLDLGRTFHSRSKAERLHPAAD